MFFHIPCLGFFRIVKDDVEKTNALTLQFDLVVDVLELTLREAAEVLPDGVLKDLRESRHPLGVAAAAQPAAGAVDLQVVTRRVTVAIVYARNLIREYKPQQVALRVFRNLLSARRMLGDFERALVLLNEARKAINPHQRTEPKDVVAAMRKGIRNCLATPESFASLPREERDELQASMAQLLEISEITPEPPAESKSDEEEIAAGMRDTYIIFQDRKALEDVEQRGHDAPLPPPLDEQRLHTDGELQGSAGIERGDYDGRPVLIKTFEGVNRNDAKMEMQLHYRAQQQCEGSVVTIVAASIGDSRARLVLQDADCTLQHLIPIPRAAEWPLLRLLRLVLLAVDATCKLHERRMYHRELNPSAVFVARDADGHDVALLSHFGRAKSERGEAGTLSMSAHAQGPSELDPLPTLKYRAPEVLTGSHGKWTREKLMAADVFPLGAMLNAVLAGTGPYPGIDNQVAMMKAAVDGSGPELFDAAAVAPSLVDRDGQTRRDVADTLQRLVEGCFLPWHRRITVASLHYGLAQAICTLGGTERGPAMPPAPGPRGFTAELRTFVAEQPAAVDANRDELRDIVNDLLQLCERLARLPSAHTAEAFATLLGALLSERHRLETQAAPADNSELTVGQQSP